jgi:hypothetical protein
MFQQDIEKGKGPLAGPRGSESCPRVWLAFVVMALKGPGDCRLTLICAVPLLKGGPYAQPTAHHILLVGSSAVATALIAWYAWKWPKQEA